tara:strand:+ start:216 stop:461 length:246 start_codon:yes stop_codon:yes gene_type:complete
MVVQPLKVVVDFIQAAPVELAFYREVLAVPVPAIPQPMEVLVVAVQVLVLVGQVQEEVGLVETDPPIVGQGVVSVPVEEHR